MAPDSNSRIDPLTTEVVAVSADALLNVRSYFCDICGKHFAREQNLMLHRRTHSFPFTLRRNPVKGRKKVYVCPEPTCIYHSPSHAIGDLGGLKKHYLRKHATEKNHKCDTCFKAYAADVDLKAHLKICGKKKHTCSCGMKFQKKSDLNLHLDHYYSAKRPNGTTNNNAETFMTGSTSSYPTIFNMEHNSARITTNHNNSTLTPQIPSLQTTSISYSNVSHYEPQLYDFEAYEASLMTNHSMGSNSFQSLHGSFPSIQQNQQDFQNNYTEGSYMQMLMGDNVSLDNFELENTFNVGNYYGQESVHNTSLNAMMDYGYGGGTGSFSQDYGHGYCG